MAKEEFTQVSNKLCRDDRLSHNAKGVWIAIASNADGFPVTLDKLVKESADGHHAVRSGLAELRKYGYVIRGERVRNELGHLGPYEYLITDLPDPPLSVVPDAENEPGARVVANLGSSTVAAEIRRPATDSGASMVVDLVKAKPSTTKDSDDNIHAAARAVLVHASVPDTEGARLLGRLRLRAPITSQVIRQHAAEVDELLRTWPAAALARHLEYECGGPEIRNPIGRLISAINDTRPHPLASTEGLRPGGCDKCDHGIVIDTIDDGCGGKDIARRCPACRPSLSTA
ncbi:hypothetical protein ACWEO2_39850 [Nocardia sp. NPDC004278]